MKKLYIQFEFEREVLGIRCECSGVKGYEVLCANGSDNAYEYSEALEKVLSIWKQPNNSGSTLITFGDSYFPDCGVQYGRLIRDWSAGKLRWVVWDERGNIVSQYDGRQDGNYDVISERLRIVQFLNVMIEKHRENVNP